MKKLLGLLGTILVTGNAIPTVIAAAPNRKHNIKKRQNNENNSTNPKMQDDQQSQFLATSDSKVDIIEKEITLNEDYSHNIQKILQELIKNNQLDPLRMINNEGIVRTDYFETQDKRNERESNIKIIEKLEKILELRKFDANKIRILVLTLKNKDNNEIKLIINLDNFYLQGFINKNNQYFYFKEEKSLNEWKQEIKKLTEELNEWNKINEEIKLLDLKKLNNIEHIINKIDEIKENLKKQWGGKKYRENKEKIYLLNRNLFYKIQINNEDSESISKLNELKEKIETLNKEKIYLGKIQEELNAYQKIQKIRQNSINLLNKGKLKLEIKKEYEENIKKYQWDNVFNKIASNIESNINTIEHKKIKENKINEEIIKKYLTNKSKKNKLNYNGSYQDKGLNTGNQNIDITKKNLNNAIKNLSFFDNESNQNQTTKDDLAKVIFITSEAMRFGSYLKYFNYEKNGQQVEFKNISTNIQKIIENKASSLNWKEYESQLIGGWNAASKDLEQKRKEIFKKLNERIIVSNFLSENNEELNEIFEASLKTNQNWETNVKSKIEIIIENYKNKEYINVILQFLENLFEASKDEIKFLKEGYKNILKFINTDHNYNLIRSVISEGNLDLLKLIITKKPELINVNNNDLTFLQVAICCHKIDIVKWLLASGADVNEKGKYGASPLYTASFKRHLKSVELLIKKAKEIYQEQSKEFKKFINKKTENGVTPLYVAVDRGYLEIVSLLLNNGAEVDTQDIEHAITSPLHCASQNGHLEIVKELLAHGADVNAQDYTGAAPLHGAADKGQLAVVKLLLAHGAKVEKNNYHNQTPLCMATIMGHIKIVNLLDSFKKLKEQLEKYQDDTDTVKEQIKDKIKDLLKIKLSYFITQTELGEIADNNKKTILNTSIGDGPTSSDTPQQNSNQKQQNIMYDVPPDNSCLFWSVATAYLLSVVDNNEEFRARFIQLFNESWLDKQPHIQKLLQNYNLENNDNNQAWYQDETAQELVRTVFRNRIVDYMNSRLGTNIVNDRDNNTLTFRDLIRIERNDANIDNYLQGMREPSTWGGTPEIIAMSNFLNSNISVNNYGSYQPINQNATNVINIFHVNDNHFNFTFSENTSQSTSDSTSTVVNKTINKNIGNLQTTTKKAINKYNTISKEEKQEKVNEINAHFQSLSEIEQKTFKDKLKTIGTSAIGAGIIAAGAKINVSDSVSGAVGSMGEDIEMTPLLSEGLTAAETISAAEGTAVIATEGAVIGAEASAATALAPETLGLSLVIGGLAIAGTAIIWWINSNHTTVKHESYNQYNEIEKYYKFLAHDQLKLDININEWNKIKQIYQENSNNYQEFKNKFKSEITNFNKEDHSGWGGSITDDDIDILINIIYNNFQEINNHFSSNPNHGWKIVTNTIGGYFIIDKE